MNALLSSLKILVYPLNAFFAYTIFIYNMCTYKEYVTGPSSTTQSLATFSRSFFFFLFADDMPLICLKRCSRP